MLKPLDGNHGRGVCINLTDEAEVREFFPVACAETRAGSVVVETFIVGKDYRILVVNNQVVAVAERVPAHVVGDGEHTVRRADRHHQRRSAPRRRPREDPDPHLDRRPDPGSPRAAGIDARRRPGDGPVRPAQAAPAT